MNPIENHCSEISLNPKRYMEYNYSIENDIQTEIQEQLAKELQKVLGQELLDSLLKQAKEIRKRLSPSSRVGRGLAERLNAI